MRRLTFEKAVYERPGVRGLGEQGRLKGAEEKCKGKCRRRRRRKRRKKKERTGRGAE